jgi:hypothetical protein
MKTADAKPDDTQPTDRYRGYKIAADASGSDGYWSAEYFVTRARVGKSDVTVLSGEVADTRFVSDQAAIDEAGIAAQHAIDLMIEAQDGSNLNEFG